MGPTESNLCHSDEDLVSQALEGRREAFAELYVRHRQRVYRLVYGVCGTHPAAEDLMQETFIRAFRKLSQFEGRSSFATWLSRVAVNLSLNYCRREGSRRSLALDDLPESATADRAAERSLVRREVIGQVERALGELTPNERIVVLLREVEGLSYAEIADRVGCSMGTVASRLSRARRLLCARLEAIKEAFD